MRWLCLLWALAALAGNCAALEREAFTFVRYELDVRVEPDQQRLGVRGKITLRNDSKVAQKNLSLQISSSLDWRSIQADGKPVQFLSQPYTSDIDHTGTLSEAIVSLSSEVAPQGTVKLEIGYEGTISQDETRLTRIGVPEESAKHSEWDQIGRTFSAVRGIGYVVWYPVATEAAILTSGNGVFEAIERWKQREAGSTMKISLSSTDSQGDPGAPFLRCNDQAVAGAAPDPSARPHAAECVYAPMARTVPAFLSGEYQTLDRPALDVFYLAGHKALAESYALAAEKTIPFVTDWFGAPRAKAEVVELPDSLAAPYDSGSMLLTPLNSIDSNLAEIAAAHQLTHAAFPSPRPWIYEGIAYFAQAVYRERQGGREAALDFLGLHRAAVADAEKAVAEEKDPNGEAAQSLIHTAVEEYYRSKAASVWWMLRDMVGESVLKKALAAYRAESDDSPAYIEHLIEGPAHRDLEWFFDDWVYRDRGLPDFCVKSVYPRKTMKGGYLVTVTIQNLGGAGAEVPIIVRFVGGESRLRLMVHGNAKNSIRFDVASLPSEVVVNDGSVPESDMKNNTFKVEAAPQSGN
jgi:hypothetical protein